MSLTRITSILLSGESQLPMPVARVPRRQDSIAGCLGVVMRRLNKLSPFVRLFVAIAWGIGIFQPVSTRTYCATRTQKRLATNRQRPCCRTHTRVNRVLAERLCLCLAQPLLRGRSPPPCFRRRAPEPRPSHREHSRHAEQGRRSCNDCCLTLKAPDILSAIAMFRQ